MVTLAYLHLQLSSHRRAFPTRLFFSNSCVQTLTKMLTFLECISFLLITCRMTCAITCLGFQLFKASPAISAFQHRIHCRHAVLYQTHTVRISLNAVPSIACSTLLSFAFKWFSIFMDSRQNPCAVQFLLQAKWHLFCKNMH